MDMELSATQIAEACDVKPEKIRALGKQGRIRKKETGRAQMYLLTADELGMLKVNFSAGTKIESMVFRGEILYLRDSCLARKHQVALGAILQAYAVTQMTESPLVAWDDLLAILQTIGAAPAEGAQTWLSQLIQSTTTGRDQFLSVEYQLYRGEASKRQAESAKKNTKRRHGKPDGMVTVTEAAKKTGVNRDRLRTMCRDGEIEGVVREGKENSPWFIPKDWTMPEHLLCPDMPKGFIAMTEMAKRHGISRDTLRRWCISGRVPGARRLQEKTSSPWIVPEDWKPPIHWGRGKATRWAK